MNKPIDWGQLEVPMASKQFPGGHGLSGETESSRLFRRVDRWELMWELFFSDTRTKGLKFSATWDVAFSYWSSLRTVLFCCSHLWRLGRLTWRFFTKVSSNPLALLGPPFFYRVSHIFLFYQGPSSDLSKPINTLGFSPLIQGGWVFCFFFLLFLLTCRSYILLFVFPLLIYCGLRINR